MSCGALEPKSFRLYWEHLNSDLIVLSLGLVARPGFLANCRLKMYATPAWDVLNSLRCPLPAVVLVVNGCPERLPQAIESVCLNAIMSRSA